MVTMTYMCRHTLESPRIASVACCVAAVFLAGCGTSRLPVTTIVVSPGPTPTIVVAHAAVRTGGIDPPWQGLPMETRTKAGKPGDPINIAFEGSRAAIVAAFRSIGWVLADPLSVRDDLRLARAAVLHESYPAAPISNLYIFGRSEDLGVERELGNTVARRDHARIWDTGRKDSKTGKNVWIGDAARDISIEIVHYHGSSRHLPIGTTHEIGPNVDAERGLIVAGMRHAGAARTVVMEPGVGPTQNGRNGENNRYYTDGKVALIVLKG